MHFTTTSGIEVEIDDDQAHLAELRGWYRHSSGYIGREVRTEGRRRLVFLHHMVLGVEPQRGRHVDHINQDRFDNRRENLRVVSPSENAQNRSVITSRGTYRGVTWHKRHQKWTARATINYKTYPLGDYDTQEEAAEAVARWRRENMTHSDADGTV